MKKRLFLLLLCVLTLAVSLCLFTACDDKTPPSGDNTGNGGTTENGGNGGSTENGGSNNEGGESAPCVHTYLSAVTLEPGCETTGTRTFVCTLCGDTYTEPVAAKGHTAVTDAAKTPTCTETGLTEGSHCSVCTKVWVAQTVVPALNHSPVTDLAVEPTCTENGLTEGSHCSVCTKVLVAQTEIKANGHSYSTSYVSDATHHYYLCACGDKKDNAAHVSSGAATATEAEYCTVCDYVITPAVGISFKTLSVSGNTVYGKVSNSTEYFSFINEITSVGGARYTVSNNIDGTSEIPNKTISLNVGDNTVYITEKINDEPTAIYIVTIRRRHIYEVTFNTNGGAPVQSQYVEEDSFATEPTTTLAGYSYVWDYNFSTPITDDTEITAIWTANTNTPYKVEYYRQNVNRNGYDLISSETINTTGQTDATATAPEKTFEHFTINRSMGKLSGNIDANGSLVLKVYYTRNTYTVSNANTSYGTITGAGSYVYGKTDTVVLTVTSTNLGYNFIGWYSGETLLSYESTYTFTVDKNVTAKFEAKAEMSGFNFTSTATTCQITGIKDKTVTEIIVPDYVTSISEGAFSGCSKLQSITIPFVGGSRKTSSDTYQYPFGYIFGTSSYTGGTRTNQYYYGSSTSSTTYDYYYIPSTLKSVTITGGNILYGAFYKCTSLTSVTIGNSVTSIGSYAFYNCTSLTSVTIPNSVTSIGSGAFSGCSKLQSITIPFVGGSRKTSSDTYQYPFGYIFGTSSYTGGTSTEQHYYGSSTSSITSTTYYIPSTLKSVTITGGHILRGAFYGCRSLTSVTIPDSVTSIGYAAFLNCTSLTSVVIPNSVTSIGSDAFDYCDSLTSVVIPNSITSIGSGAFSGCYKLVEVINKSTLNITKGSTGNGGVGFYALEIHNGESKIVNKDGYLFITYNSLNYLLGYTGTDTALILPNDYNGQSYEIYKYAFRYCNSLTSVTIPSSVKTIGNNAFYECTNLKTVNIPENSQLLSIGFEAFYDCDSLTSIVIPNSVTSIGSSAFYYCDSITSVVIPNSVTSIGWDAFYGCTSLTSVVIPNSVTSIGDETFRDCTSLTSVVIPDSVTSIGSSAFFGCTSLTSVTIGSGVTSIGSSAFSGCDSLTSVTIGSGVTSIGSSAFYDCTSLTSIKYRGTESQWDAISKGYNWNKYYSNGSYYTINYTMTYNYTGQ